MVWLIEGALPQQFHISEDSIVELIRSETPPKVCKTDRLRWSDHSLVHWSERYMFGLTGGNMVRVCGSSEQYIHSRLYTEKKRSAAAPFAPFTNN